MNLARELERCANLHVWAHDEVPALLRRAAAAVSARPPLRTLSLDERVEDAIRTLGAIIDDTTYTSEEREDALMKVLSAVPRVRESVMLPASAQLPLPLGPQEDEA